MKRVKEMNKLDMGMWVLIVIIILTVGTGFVSGFGVNKLAERKARQIEASAAAPAPGVITHWGEMICEREIAQKSHGLAISRKIDEGYYPGTGEFWAKYALSGTDSNGKVLNRTAIGSARYIGGVAYSNSSWEVHEVKMSEE